MNCLSMRSACGRSCPEGGAVPVTGGGPDGPHLWILQRQYGSQPEEIIKNVIREWLANGAQDEDPGGLWFALPQYAWTQPS